MNRMVLEMLEIILRAKKLLRLTFYENFSVMELLFCLLVTPFFKQGYVVRTLFSNQSAVHVLTSSYQS